MVAGTEQYEFGEKIRKALEIRLGREKTFTTRNACRGTFQRGCAEKGAHALSRVTSTLYSGDSRFILSGSDDGNIRIWKARANEKMGVVTARERAAMEYREALKQKWSVDKEVGRVMRYALLPIFLFLAHVTVQDATFAQVNPFDIEAQAYDGRSAAGQGGEAAEAFTGGRAETQGCAKKGGPYGAKVDILSVQCMPFVAFLE